MESDMEEFVMLTKTRSHRKLRRVRRRMDRTKLNDLVLRRYDDINTILMLMFKRSLRLQLQQDSPHVQTPRKVNQCQSIKTLKQVLFKHLFDTEIQWLILDMKGPDYGLCVLNELAETGYYCEVRYLLSKLSPQDRLRAVLDKNPSMVFPDSLFRISQVEPKLHKILRALKVFPIPQNIIRQCNTPYHAEVCPDTGYIGTAIIINISFREEGAQQHMRIGGDSDHDKISSALSRLHFKVQTLEETVNDEQVLGHVDALKTSMTGSIFCLVIQTHRVLGKIAMSNTAIDIDHLINKIHASLPSEIMKGAFLQHCRVELDNANPATEGASNIVAFRGKLPGENWLIGYAHGYGRTSARNTYITELSQVLSSITEGRYLEDVLREVHSKVKAIASDQNPEY